MKKPTTKVTHDLLDKLRILDEIEPAIGQQYENHVLLKDGWAIGFNGVIAGGCKITESIEACPDIELLISTLAKCGQNIAFTQLATNRLSIKSDKFRALVPCLEISDFPTSLPDAPVAQLDDRLKASILAASSLAGDSETDILLSSILIHGGSVVATDRKLILEHWHGIDLPPMLALPKAIIAPLLKNSKSLKAFGFSKSSCTFYYDDESWLRSQFYADPWPDVSRILDIKANAWPLPEDFYKAVKSLEPFSDTVYFDSGVMRSHISLEEGASYEIYGLPKGPIFSIKQLKTIEPYVKTIDFLAQGPNGPLSIWYGDGCRGAIAGRVK